MSLRIYICWTAPRWALTGLFGGEGQASIHAQASISTSNPPSACCSSCHLPGHISLSPVRYSEHSDSRVVFLRRSLEYLTRASRRIYLLPLRPSAFRASGCILGQGSSGQHRRRPGTTLVQASNTMSRDEVHSNSLDLHLSRKGRLIDPHIAHPRYFFCVRVAHLSGPSPFRLT
ncbi:hypothetical protein F5Y15DRAFT_121329 [Xylariaceae sp. FL0016]|nr:hypothetical protein F5Y15DRAFT_121329 [Xylariaceae sp. FL0016]